MSPVYKYAGEAGINMYLHLYQLCQQDEFEVLQTPEYAESLKYYNIYFVCQRPRTEIVPDSISFKKKEIHFNFIVHKDQKKYLVPMAMRNVFGTTKLSIKSSFPFNYYELVDKKGNVRFAAKTSYALDARKIAMNYKFPFLDLEILYIGRTTKASSKPTIERLVQHSKLQKIYSDVNRTNPDKEVFIVLCNFIQDGTVEVRGTVETNPKYQKEDLRRIKKFLQTQLELKPAQKTIVTEAALIKYFKPKYNIEYKSSFPTKKHAAYNAYYKMDLNAVSIELNTDLNYFTDHVSSNNIHFHRFFLPTESDRRKLFNFEEDPPVSKPILAKRSKKLKKKS